MQSYENLFLCNECKYQKRPLITCLKAGCNTDTTPNWEPKSIVQKLADCCITEPKKITAPNFRRINICFICKNFMPKLDINYQGRCGKYEFSVEDCETSVCDGFEGEK
jgi:hypothetical protein